MHLTAPIWRYIGSAASWLLFAFSVSLLFLSAQVIAGLGGYCASGGPYVIQTECPDTVVWATPTAIFGGLLAIGIGGLVARGFGTPLIAWAWPVLFIGLGVVFELAAFTASFDVGNLLIGLLLVVMGAVPLVLELRAGPQRSFLGAMDAHGTRFAEHHGARRGLYSFAEPEPGTSREARAADWVTSLLILVVFGAAGILLAALVFRTPQ
ncbi:MAG TPA: hypothetical protein VN759_08210 [Pseudolysinimonas sp.]|nr:hypothetical protein [Pseudolysinimonas sp.]